VEKSSEWQRLTSGLELNSERQRRTELRRGVDIFNASEASTSLLRKSKRISTRTNEPRSRRPSERGMARHGRAEVRVRPTRMQRRKRFLSSRSASEWSTILVCRDFSRFRKISHPAKKPGPFCFPAIAVLALAIGTCVAVFLPFVRIPPRVDQGPPSLCGPLTVCCTERRSEAGVSKEGEPFFYLDYVTGRGLKKPRSSIRWISFTGWIRC